MDFLNFFIQWSENLQTTNKIIRNMFYNPKKIPTKRQKTAMKSIVFSFFMLIFGTCGIFAQTTDWEKYDLKGRVKSVKTSYKYHFEENFFTENGEITEEIRVYDDGKRIYKNKFVRNDENQLIESLEFDFLGDLNKKKIYEYDKGKLVSEVALAVLNFPDRESSLFLYSITYKYDTKGRLISSSSFNFESKCPVCPEEGTTSYVYDSQGFLKEIILKSGNFLSKTNFLRDNNGHILQEKIYYNRPKSITLFIYKNDFHGNWTKKEIYKNNELTEIQERKIEYYN